MKIKKVVGCGIILENGVWIREDHAAFPTGTLYTEDEVEKEVKKRMLSRKFISIDDYNRVAQRINYYNHL